MQVSVESVRALDARLFESYVERKADPIVGSLEPGIYAGYFDWRDCSPPTGNPPPLPPPPPNHKTQGSYCGMGWLVLGGRFTVKVSVSSA